MLFPFVYLGIGDAVCHTGLWRELKKQGHRVQIITGKSSEALFRNLDCVDKVYIVDINRIQNLATVETDLVVCLYSWMERKEILETQLLARVRYSYAISIGGLLKKPYNITLKLPEKFHITDPQRMLLQQLGYSPEGLQYELQTRPSSDDFIATWLQRHCGKKIVVLNPYASVMERSMSEQQLFSVIAAIKNAEDIHIFIIGEQHKLNTLAIDAPGISVCHFDSLWHTISLVNKADLVISVETGIVHIACALRKNLVSIFYSTNINYNDALQSNTIIEPLGGNVRQIIFNRTSMPFNADIVAKEALLMLDDEDDSLLHRTAS